MKIPKALEVAKTNAAYQYSTHEKEQYYYIQGADWMAAQLLPMIAELEKALAPVAECGNCGGCRDSVRAALELTKEWRGGE